MSASELFSLANLVALVAWLALLASLFVPRLRPATWLATSLAVPALFGGLYVVILVTTARQGGGGGFNTIDQVRALFASDFGLVTGWVHYLAFDLFVGSWIVRSGVASAINRFALVPCLLLTFLFGPLGFLSYIALRLVTGHGLPAPGSEGAASA